MEAIRKEVEDFKKGLRTTSTEDMDETDHTAATDDDFKPDNVDDSCLSETSMVTDEDETALPLSEPLQKFVAHVPDIPSQKDMEEKILRAKKMELLKQYASDQMIKQAEESRRILGYSDSAENEGES